METGNLEGWGPWKAFGNIWGFAPKTLLQLLANAPRRFRGCSVHPWPVLTPEHNMDAHPDSNRHAGAVRGRSVDFLASIGLILGKILYSGTRKTHKHQVL